MSVEADTGVTASWARELTDAYLLCRDIGHQWRAYTARYVPEQNGYERTLRCGRCQTERRQTLSLNGHVTSGSYSYPEGYQQPHGSGRLTGDAKDALRIESVMRLIGRE